MTREQKAVRKHYKNLVHAPRRLFPYPREPLDAPNRQGVYVIYDSRGQVAHVGRTPRGKGGIAQRLRDHLHGASSFTAKYLDGRGSRLRGKFSFQYLIVKHERQRALLEAYAAGCLCPAHFGTGASPPPLK